MVHPQGGPLNGMGRPRFSIQRVQTPPGSAVPAGVHFWSPAHNPKVDGSNPSPATTEGPARSPTCGAFALRRRLFGGVSVEELLSGQLLDEARS